MGWQQDGAHGAAHRSSDRSLASNWPSRQTGGSMRDYPADSCPPAWPHRHRQSGELFDLGSQFPASIASVDDCTGLEQKRCCFDIGARTVLDAAGDDEELSRREHHIAVSHLNGELSVEDEEELVGVGVPVPGELALNLHDPDVVVVDLGNLLRQPVLSETR